MIFGQYHNAKVTICGTSSRDLRCFGARKSILVHKTMEIKMTNNMNNGRDAGRSHDGNTGRNVSDRDSKSAGKSGQEDKNLSGKNGAERNPGSQNSGGDASSKEMPSKSASDRDSSRESKDRR